MNPTPTTALRAVAAWLLAGVAATAAAQGASDAGAQLAARGAEGIAPCASCHGANGEGMATSGFPRLAGQPARYLQHQLESYADDSRRHPVMQPIAKAMSPQQRVAAAAYYASLTGSTPSSGAKAAPAASTKTGGARTTAAPRSAGSSVGLQIATVGLRERGVQGCANCHGPEGTGESSYPYLAGQHAGYLSAALAAWKDGSRDNDPSGQMQRIARSLGDADVAAVVAYFAALPPPGPVATTRPVARAGSGRTIVSGPVGGGGATGSSSQGIGTEQGAPLSGGTQGVGGPGNPQGPRSGATQGGAAEAGASAPGR